MDKKEQTRLRVQRYRNKKALHDSVTSSTPESVTALQGSVTQNKENVTLWWIRAGKKEILTEVPEGYRVLSDGQLWKHPLRERPELVEFEDLPEDETERIAYIKEALNDGYLIEEIERIHQYFVRIGNNNHERTLVKRYERAYSYLLSQQPGYQFKVLCP